MNLAEVAELISQLKKQKLSSAYLQAYKPHGWRPKGFKFKTLFGLATILNVVDRESSSEDHTDFSKLRYTSVVFMIELAKVERWYRKNLGAYFEDLKKEGLIHGFKINEDLSVTVHAVKSLDFILTDVKMDGKDQVS